ncbi:SAUR auxin-responsive protein family [Trifolium repens]|nr:SAUR auxin-responsive protein family [Trifolium repens]
MDINTTGKSMKQGNKKSGLITKTWERCKSIGRGGHKSKYPSSVTPTTRRSKSWPNLRGGKKGGVVAPVGCFSVYVGPQMQRFVIKTEYANHPLFKMLLEEAESEYGYSCQGPLALPCNVDVFYKVLMEMDSETPPPPRGCAFLNRSRSSYHLLSPSRMIVVNDF